MKNVQLSKLKSKFRYLGKFMAKACMDSRMVDINISEAFYKWLVSQEDYALDICDLQFVDQTLYTSLSQLYGVVLAKRRLERDDTHTKDSLALALSTLTLEGVPIEDLGLDFVLPGTCHELKKNGKDTPVIIENLDEYLQVSVGLLVISCSWVPFILLILDNSNCHRIEEKVEIIDFFVSIFFFFLGYLISVKSGIYTSRLKEQLIYAHFVYQNDFCAGSVPTIVRIAKFTVSLTYRVTECSSVRELLSYRECRFTEGFVHSIVECSRY